MIVYDKLQNIQLYLWECICCKE